VTAGGDIVRTSSNVGGMNEIAVINTATSGASSSRLRISTAFNGGTTLGDALTQYTDNNNFNWATGSGVTTSRDYVITNHFTLGTSVFFRLAASTGAATFSNSVTATSGFIMNSQVSSLYETNGALSYYSTTNGVYLNGAGPSGWLRLNGAGSENDRNSINIYGSASGVPDTINFNTSGFTRLSITSTGAATFSNTVRVNGGELTVYSGSSVMYTGVDTGNNYVYFGTNTANYGISFQASGDRMRIFNDGNVSINNTSNAGFKLDVNGTGRFSGQVNFDYRITLPDMTIGYWDGANNRIESGSLRPLLITAYSQPINMGINGGTNFSINTSGAATFSSSVSLGGGSEGLRLGNVGDNSAYDNVKLWYTGFNGGAPRIYLTPRTTPGSGVINTFFHLLNTNGSSTSSNNTMGLIVDGQVGIGTSPTQKLHIDGQNGQPATSGATQNGILRIQGGSGVGFGETLDMGFHVGVSGPASYAWLQSTNTGNLGINYNLALNPNGGNVLIGTSANPTPVAGVSFPLTITSSAATRIRIDSTQATPNSGVGLYANGVQKFSFAMFGTDSDFTIYNDALLASALLVKGTNSNVLIGTTTDVGAKLYVNGAFRTGTLTAGTQTAAVDWRLGNARGGAATNNALIRVEINGVLVDLLGNYV
jgi:hypothetical protein